MSFGYYLFYKLIICKDNLFVYHTPNKLFTSLENNRKFVCYFFIFVY